MQNAITDTVINTESLAGDTSLKVLHLHEITFERGGLLDFAEVIRQNETLETLTFTITNKRMADEAAVLIDALAGNYTLINLALYQIELYNPETNMLLHKYTARNQTIHHALADLEAVIEARDATEIGKRIKSIKKFMSAYPEYRHKKSRNKTLDETLNILRFLKQWFDSKLTLNNIIIMEMANFVTFARSKAIVAHLAHLPAIAAAETVSIPNTEEIAA